jgi:hypothetical protein
LETERGRNCALRKFFPDEIFWSAQFDVPAPGSNSTKVIVNGEAHDVISCNEVDAKIKEIKVGKVILL